MFHKTCSVCLVFLALSVHLASPFRHIGSEIKEESRTIIEIDGNHTEYHTRLSIQESEDAAALESKKALEIYKVIMIFTCCVLAIVLVCFLICILKNTDSLAAQPTSSTANLNEAYLSCEDGSISVQNGSLLINLPFEKPPSYLDVLKEIGSPPPIYTSSDSTITLSSSVQNQEANASSAVRVQNELVLDCNQWLERANNERSSLETRLAIELRRSELRRLSRNLERFPNILSRCHSSPIIRNSLLLKNQHLIDILSSPPDATNPVNTNNPQMLPMASVNLVEDRTNLPDQSSASTSQI